MTSRINVKPSFPQTMDTKYKRGSATATWLQELNLAGPRENPLYVWRIPTKLMYLRRYALYIAYITPLGNNETLRTFKRRVYGTLHIMARAAKEAPEMRITRLNPETNWRQVWTHSLGTRRNQIKLVRSGT